MREDGLEKGARVHFDTAFQESPGHFIRAVGDGIIRSRVRTDVKTILVEVTVAQVKDIRQGDLIRMPLEDATRLAIQSLRTDL